MTPPQPSSQTLRERIQECLDSDGSKTWRAELLEECLAALAAQEASPNNPCPDGWHVAESMSVHRRCAKCGHEWDFPAKTDADLADCRQEQP